MSEEIELGEFLRQVEELIADLERKMVLALSGSPLYDLEALIRAWTQAQGLWLQHAQQMSRDQARDELVAFAHSHQFARWMEGKRPGPPPNVLAKWKRAE
ncbi:MAG: hypothetical protein J2P37_19355 [Ktedonobacteraceae bacterium]|nr:hypothetical protein [Ktedonobacteraceae bacterium]